MNYNNQAIQALSCDKILPIERENVVAFCITPWHSVGIEVALEKLNSLEKQLNGHLFICKHPKTGLALSPTSVNLSSYGNFKTEIYNIPAASPLKKLFDHIYHFFHIIKSPNFSADKPSCYVISPLNPDYKTISDAMKLRPDENIIAVVVDEGLGGRSRFSWFISRIHDGINPLKSFITFLQEITLDKISYSQLVKKGCLIDQTLFVKKHGNFFVQNKLAEKYRSILETRNLADDKQNFSIYENAIIINTQPFEETGQLQNNADIYSLKKIIQSLQNCGEKVIIKPHPREKNLDRYKDLGCIIEKRKGIAQEEILSTLKTKPKAVIGFCSTTLVTAKIFWDIPTYSCIHMINSKNISPSLNKDFKRFIKYYGNTVSIPATENILLEEISQ